jgi:hypothetical protein
MSVSREPSEELESHFKTTLIASLTVYNSAPTSKSKFKAANKSAKVKEIDFTIMEDNYLQILREILNSCSQEKYKVTARSFEASTSACSDPPPNLPSDS